MEFDVIVIQLPGCLSGYHPCHLWFDPQIRWLFCSLKLEHAVFPPSTPVSANRKGTKSFRSVVKINKVKARCLVGTEASALVFYHCSPGSIRIDQLVRWFVITRWDRWVFSSFSPQWDYRNASFCANERCL